MNDYNFENVSLGHDSYGELNVVDFGRENKLRNKNSVSIAQMFHSFLMQIIILITFQPIHLR